jgi:formate/nitrite transporter FocA (FNT family)
MKLTNLFLAITQGQVQEIVNPITQLINVIVPVLLGLVGSIGLVYCILLGVKYARSSDPQEHEQAKKALIHAIIGFVLIFVLLIMCNVALPYLIDFWQSYGN